MVVVEKINLVHSHGLLNNHGPKGGIFKADEVFKKVASENSALMEKISLFDTLDQEEQRATLKMIDLALSNKN